MIRFIAAIDNKNGIANDHGIPWIGKLPTDQAQYRQKIHDQPIIMGYGHYIELKRPYPESDNYVATSRPADLEPGFAAVADAHSFIEEFMGDIWNIGGAQLYQSTIDLADELYLTRINKDFECTKFFPAFEDQFKLVTRSDPQEENDITFCFELWARN